MTIRYTHRMVLGASAGGLAVVAVAVVILFAIFGTKILRRVVQVAAIIFLLYLAWLWRADWLPYVRPIIDAARSMWHTATAGPQ